MWNNFVSNRNSSFISQILVENRKKNGKQNFIIIVIGEQKHMYPLGHTHAQVFSNKRRALRKCVCVCVCLRKCALVWIWMLTHCNFTTSISKTRIGSWEFAARKKKRKRHGRRQRRDGKEGGDFRVSDWNRYALSRFSLQGTIWVSNYSLFKFFFVAAILKSLSTVISVSFFNAAPWRSRVFVDCSRKTWDWRSMLWMCTRDLSSNACSRYFFSLFNSNP